MKLSRITTNLSGGSAINWCAEHRESRAKRILLLAVIVCTSLAIGSVVRAQPCPNPCNLVVNSDFSAGNTGFSCDPAGMTYQAGAGSAGHECVGTKLSDETSGWPAGGDHTTGTGKFLCIDGSLSNNMDVWIEKVTACPVSNPATFVFSFWAKNAHAPGSQYDDGPLIIKMMVNGSMVGSPQTITSTSWTRYSVTYTASSGPTFISLRQTTGGLFRDCGIDDISLTYCPTPKLDCHCPPDWRNETNVFGGPIASNGRCKKALCGWDAATYGQPTQTTLPGNPANWGFTWDNAIWVWGTATNGGAVRCDTIPCRNCYPYHP